MSSATAPASLIPKPSFASRDPPAHQRTTRRILTDHNTITLLVLLDTAPKFPPKDATKIGVLLQHNGFTSIRASLDTTRLRKGGGDFKCNPVGSLRGKSQVSKESRLRMVSSQLAQHLQPLLTSCFGPSLGSSHGARLGSSHGAEPKETQGNQLKATRRQISIPRAFAFRSSKSPLYSTTHFSFIRSSLRLHE